MRKFIITSILTVIVVFALYVPMYLFDENSIGIKIYIHILIFIWGWCLFNSVYKIIEKNIKD